MKTFLKCALVCMPAGWCLFGIPCRANTFSYTQLCWEAPATTSSTPNINQAAYADCSKSNPGSLDVVTPGASGDQTFIGSASAQASPGTWHVAAYADLTNYMRDMYLWSSTSTNSEVEPTTVDATAGMSDTLTVSSAGGPGVYSLNYIFSIEGTLTASDDSLFTAELCAVVSLPQGVGTVTSHCIFPGQPVPSTFMLTYSDLPFGGPVTPTVSINAIANVEALSSNQVGTSSDTVFNADVNIDFANTVQLTDVLVTDSNGNPIPGVSISSLNGYNYPLDTANAVPEPRSVFLLATGMCSWLIVQKRRRSRLLSK